MMMMMMMLLIDLSYTTRLRSILARSAFLLPPLSPVSYLVYFLDYSCSELTKKGKGEEKG